MIRTLSIIISIMVMLVSCQTNVVEEQKIELKNQLIGLTSAHNHTFLSLSAFKDLKPDSQKSTSQ